MVDDAIPFIKGVLEPFAEVMYKGGRDISREDVKDADALIIRTRTKCNRDLLEGSRVKFIATATIGTDHIDFPYCNSKGILVRNAAGCNAGGVMNYVFSALYGIASRKAIKLDGATLGIIGVGNVGKRVERMALSLGFKVLRNDPPRMEAEGPHDFCDLDYLLRNSDVVTMHVPLDDTTRSMADESFFGKMRPGAIFINASRGEAVVDSALKAAVPKLGAVIRHCNPAHRRVLLSGEAERHGDGGKGLCALFRFHPSFRILPQDGGPGTRIGQARPQGQEPGGDNLAPPVQLSHLHRRFHVPGGPFQIRNASFILPVQKGVLHRLTSCRTPAPTVWKAFTLPPSPGLYAGTCSSPTRHC